MEKEGLLLDNVESSWRGILDMTINDADKTLYGLTSTPVYFGLWAAPLEEMKFEDSTGKIHYEVKKGLAVKKPMISNNNEKKNLPANFIQISEAQKILQQKNIDIDLNNILGNYLESKNTNVQPEDDVYKTPKKEIQGKEDSPNKKKEVKYIENINNVIKNNIMNPQKPFQKKNYEQPPVKTPPNYEQQAFKSPANVPNEFPIRNEDPTKQINEKMFEYNEESKETNMNEINDISPKNMYIMPQSVSNEEPSKRKNNVKVTENPNQDIDLDDKNNENKIENNKDFENSIINAQNTNLSNDLHFASFIIDKDNNEKYQQFDLINEVSKEHSKFVSVLNTRSNYIKPIVHYLNTGNIKSALFLLSK